ncbi:Z-ring formation inhibitor MciZ [Bacillus massilinigeriensis]|uniref:Z-ring formation inhibitor MciZ n=1 Tax=Bacillus mediterraneensis TaxID=1805474 RepID=UPI0024AEB4F6|nr:Z-ring formation inhibitor MciZ [Bacillus mediterraneensis]
MKTYMHTNRVVMTGKAWEIIAMLRQYQQRFFYVTDWMESFSEPLPKERETDYL